MATDLRGALDQARSPRGTFWHEQHGDLASRPIAYFSAEFAFHQSLPIYAGGLGVLAGDHVKEASDLWLPLVAVGFMYPQGYFHQKVSAEGWQEEAYEQLNWSDAPIQLAAASDGKPCIIAVRLAARSVLVQVCRVRLGRVQLFLLDTGLVAGGAVTGTSAWANDCVGSPAPPAAGALTVPPGATIKVSGITEPGATVTINGRPQTLRLDKLFSAEIHAPAQAGTPRIALHRSRHNAPFRSRSCRVLLGAWHVSHRKTSRCG